MTNAVFGAGPFGWIGDGSHVRVSDSVFRDTFIGVYADGWKRLTVTQTKVINNRRVGMSLWNTPIYLPKGFLSSDALVEGNSFEHGGVIDIYLDGGVNVSVRENEFSGPTAYTSILAVRQNGSDFRNNRLVRTAGGSGPDILVAISEAATLAGNNHKLSGKTGWTAQPLKGTVRTAQGRSWWQAATTLT